MDKKKGYTSPAYLLAKLNGVCAYLYPRRFSDLRKATVTPNELSTERPMALYANV